MCIYPQLTIVFLFAAMTTRIPRDVVKKLFSSYDRNLRLKFKGRCLDEIISDRHLLI